MSMYTLNDFFCGCGGLGLGLQNAGFKILKAWDKDKFAVQSYRENIGDHVVQADIQTLHIADIPSASAWSFGFPCQDLSVAGKQAGIKLKCLNCGTVWEINGENYTGNLLCPCCKGKDYQAASRSGMFFEIMRLLQEAKYNDPDKLPDVLIAENVKALRKYLPILDIEYKKAGYKMYSQLFNSKWWNVPQSREQHTSIPKLSSILEDHVSENFYLSNEKAKKIIDQARKRLSELGNIHAVLTPDRVNKRQNGRRAKENEEEMFTLTAQDIHGVILAAEMTKALFTDKDNCAYCCQANYDKGLSPSKITAHARTHIIEFDGQNYVVRKLTPTEYGRLQGFPDTWKQVVSNSQAYKQFGNAVTVTLAEAIGKSIIDFLLQSGR